MKFVCKVEINKPISEVVELWKNEGNFKYWQDGFIKIEHLNEPDKVGSKSKILFEQNKRKMELIETITVLNLPSEKNAIYEHTHMTNTSTTNFIDLGNSRTEYTAEIEYTKFNGIIPKLMSKFFPGIFKKQTQKWLNQFKEFAE